MQNARVIARLDIKSPNVVKGIQMVGFRKAGDPAALAQVYNAQGADELLMVDIVASLYQRDPDVALVRSVAKELSIPLTVAGGIRNLSHIDALLQAGADKVAINTYALEHPQFLFDAAQKFGSQCIVLSVEAKHMFGKTYEAYTNGGREHTGRDVVEWVQEAQELGIGEILLTAIDRDGTKKGLDPDLLERVQRIATVPVILSGGAKDAGSVRDAIDAGADAVAIASILHNGSCTIDMLKNALYAPHPHV